jgi:hypothetical protein
VTAVKVHRMAKEQYPALAADVSYATMVRYLHTMGYRRCVGDKKQLHH